MARRKIQMEPGQLNMLDESGTPWRLEENHQCMFYRKNGRWWVVVGPVRPITCEQHPREAIEARHRTQHRSAEAATKHMKILLRIDKYQKVWLQVLKIYPMQFVIEEIDNVRK